MVTIRCLDCASIELYWPEMKRLWRQDAFGRHHPTGIEDLRRSMVLEKTDLWIVWDTEPTDIKAWGGAHYCLGIVSAVNMPVYEHMRAGFLAGRSLKKWAPAMAQSIDARAAELRAKRLHVYCRKGWLQDLWPHWHAGVKARRVYFHRDPDPDPLAIGATARAKWAADLGWGRPQLPQPPCGGGPPGGGQPPDIIKPQPPGGGLAYLPGYGWIYVYYPESGGEKPQPLPAVGGGGQPPSGGPPVPPNPPIDVPPGGPPSLGAPQPAQPSPLRGV
jgi:hypothetical protein